MQFSCCNRLVRELESDGHYSMILLESFVPWVQSRAEFVIGSIIRVQGAHPIDPPVA